LFGRSFCFRLTQAHSESTRLAERVQNVVLLCNCAAMHFRIARKCKGLGLFGSACLAPQKKTFCIIRAKSACGAFFCAALSPELARRVRARTKCVYLRKMFFVAREKACLRQAFTPPPQTETKTRALRTRFSLCKTHILYNSGNLS